MFAILATLLFAVQPPIEFMDSVATARYWLKKDAQGRGDEICEKAMPKRYVAFATAQDMFRLVDPAVRTANLERVEIEFRGRMYPAREVARTEFPDTVSVKTDVPVVGLKPLVFGTNAPCERAEFRFEHGHLIGTGSSLATNAFTRVCEDGSLIRVGTANTLLLDKARRPVWIDFGQRLKVKEGVFIPPPEAPEMSPDVYEQAAGAVEERVRRMAVGVFIHLDQKDRDAGSDRMRFVFSSGGDDDENRNDYDAIGLVVNGRVFVPIALDGERISRLSKAEAMFADGKKVELRFGGTLAEWNAIVFDFPFGMDLGGLRPSAIRPEALDRTRAWRMRLENENGRVRVFAQRRVFQGVDFVRGATYAASDGDMNRWSEDRHLRFTLDAAGDIAIMHLARRFSGDRWGRTLETIVPGELSAMMAGDRFNPEFAPRREEDRNRFVWLGVDTVALTDALAREKKAQSYLADYSRPPLVTEVYAGSPADKAGIAVGDVLLAVRRGTGREQKLRAESSYSSRNWADYFNDSSSSSLFSLSLLRNVGTPWPNVEDPINTMLTGYGVGAKIAVVYARDGERREAAIVLEPAPVHYRNAPKSRNRSLGLSVKDMTFEVRKFFKLDDDAPGVVIAKVKPGSPAAVAGLKPFEIVTEVNGVPVGGAKDFAARIKGVKSMTLGVRHLAQTRMVKIEIR